MSCEAMKYKQQAFNFITALTGSSETVVTFKTNDDDLTRKSPSLKKNIKGSLADSTVYERLKNTNNGGAGIFVVLNEQPAPSELIKIRCLFQHVNKEEVSYQSIRDILKPHAIVEIWPGNFHLYWGISDCHPHKFLDLQTCIVKRFGGNQKVIRFSYAMRVPGFFHWGAIPNRIKLLEWNSHDPYTVEQIEESPLCRSGATTTWYFSI